MEREEFGGEKIILSIIVPCYNSYNYLSRGLDVLRKQNTSKVEIIIIDDSSTDGSYEKLCSYQKQSGMNIKVLKNETNVGPGCSRNRGIDVSVGKYITFMDADDSFSDDFIESIMPILSKEYDCVLFDGYAVHNEEKKYLSALNRRYKEGLIEKKEALVFSKGAPWEKVYLKSRIKAVGAQFLNMKRTEDLPFTKQALSGCDRIYYYPKPLYNYINNANSLTHNKELENYLTIQTAYEYISENISDNYLEEKEAIFIEEYLYATALVGLKNLKKYEYITNLERIKAIYPQYLKNKYFVHLRIQVKLVAIFAYFRLYLLIRVINKLRK